MFEQLSSDKSAQTSICTVKLKHSSQEKRRKTHLGTLYAVNTLMS